MRDVRAEQSEQLPLPAWPVRWFILFRLYPRLLFDAEFLRAIILRRGRVFWDGILKRDRDRRLLKLVKEGRACEWRSPKNDPPHGDWRDD
jgi:hypothetical protein